VPRTTPTVATVVLAGGSGTRLALSGGANKVYLPLEGRPLLSWSLRALYEAVHPVASVLVIRAGDQAAAASAIAAAETPAPLVVVGGSSRTESEVAGIHALRDLIQSGAVDVVLVHDGARPFPPVSMLTDLIRAATTHGVAVPAVPVEPGLLERSADPGAVGVSPAATADIRAVQTPQAVAAPTLLAAADDAMSHRRSSVDTASLVHEHIGLRAVVVTGHPDNLKVTRPEDVARATTIAASRAQP
jgi:2-C-methyl-D-erythritol 4-phosphate cytidylyltransferase